MRDRLLSESQQLRTKLEGGPSLEPSAALLVSETPLLAAWLSVAT